MYCIPFKGQRVAWASAKGNPRVMMTMRVDAIRQKEAKDPTAYFDAHSLFLRKREHRRPPTIYKLDMWEKA
eukprot:scaffold4954_cov106-Cylindrotheca_fusiformis.AAC.5